MRSLQLFRPLTMLFFMVCLACGVAVMADASVYTVTDGSIGTTSTMISAAKRERGYLLIQNKGSSSIYLKVDSAHSGMEGIQISAGGYYEPVTAPVNALYLKSASGSISYTIIEGTKQ